MKCIDCNGSKFYVGLGFTQQQEPCRRCEGSGVEPNSVPKETANKTSYSNKTRAIQYDAPQNLTLAAIEGISDGLQCFPTPVEIEEVRDNVYWLCVGRRSPPQCSTDRMLANGSGKDFPKAVVLEHAQNHFLALYEREGTQNKFHCIWHY